MTDTYETMRYWDKELTHAIEAGNSQRIAYCRDKFESARSVALARQRTAARYGEFESYLEDEGRENPYVDEAHFHDSI